VVCHRAATSAIVFAVVTGTRTCTKSVAEDGIEWQPLRGAILDAQLDLLLVISSPFQQGRRGLWLSVRIARVQAA